VLERLALVFAILPASALAAPAPAKTPAQTPALAPVQRCVDDYPESAVQAGIEGETALSFTVTSQGTVTDVKIVHSSGNADLDAASVVCAGKWKYSPAKKKGVPVATVVQATAGWNLHEPPFPWPAAWTRPQPVGASHECSRFFPDAARRDHAEGTTGLAFTVTRDGKVKDAKVFKPSGDADLDAAAIACAQSWTYQPATRAGVAIDAPWHGGVQWMIGDPPIPLGPYPSCVSFAQAKPEKMPQWKTIVDYQLMADGTTHFKQVELTSGNWDLDKAGERCIEGSKFDTSKWKVPPEGLAEQAIIDWQQQFSGSAR
jgi:TonB family protein